MEAAVWADDCMPSSSWCTLSALHVRTTCTQLMMQELLGIACLAQTQEGSLLGEDLPVQL